MKVTYYDDECKHVWIEEPHEGESGTCREYYYSPSSIHGKLKWEVPVVNGEWHGTSKEYLENGDLKEYVTYRNGLVWGPMGNHTSPNYCIIFHQGAGGIVDSYFI